MMLPPVVPATNVEVPGVNVPREVLNDAKVIVDPFATSVPEAAVAIVPVDVIPRLDVVRIVFPVGLGAVF